MKRFITSLTAFISSTQSLTATTNSDYAAPDMKPLFNPPEPVSLRPLNYPGENLFAGHRSHSSHSSHRSHRSSSGGSSSYRAPSTPRYSSPTPATSSANSFYGSGASSNPIDPGRPDLVTPTPGKPKAEIKWTDKEKQKIQVMRVQIALKNLGLYDGEIDGILGPKTREAITFFQKVKDLTPNGRMTTETLNALGVKAVN